MAVGKHNHRWKPRQSCTHIIQKLIQLLKIVHLKHIWQHLIKNLHNSCMSTFMINTFGGNLFGGRIRNLHKSISKCKKRGGKKKNIWGKSFSQAFSKIPCKIFYQLLPLAYKWHNKYPSYISQRWRDQIQLCKILQHFKIELGTAPAFHTQIADTRLLRGNESWW